MKRLTVFVCGLLMLASCQDIEDVRTLPKEFSISDITDVSKLTYDELEDLVMNANYYDPVYQKEEMRRNGGLIIKGMVTLGIGESYNYANLWSSTEKSNLPSNKPSIWNAEGLECLTNDVNNPFFFQSNQQMMNSENVSTYYYELELTKWDSEFPGFVDECLYDDYSQMAFSSVKEYTRPEVPYIFDCTMDGGNAIYANFHVKSRYTVSEGGICYSMTKQLPAMSDSVVYCSLDNGLDKYNLQLSAAAFPQEGGTYYVRAFSTSKEGTGYSPVRKVSIY